jgi:glutathione S-transferase
MDRLTLVIGSKNYSSWSLRAWLALRVTGEPFDEVVVALGQPETKAEILGYSPSGKVPVLRQGPLTVWDSLAICEYLAECFPEAGLWPADRGARATARSVVAEVHSGFQALRQNMPMDCRASLPGEGRAEGVRQDIDRIVQIWDTCRHCFGGEGELLFGSFTIADAFSAPVVSRFVTYGVEPASTAARAYMDAIWALPAMADWVAAARQEPKAPR